MIAKPRDKTIELERLHALYRRLPVLHRERKKVKIDFKKKNAGLRGEKEVDYPLSFLSKKDYLILHNLRLGDESGFFQIDSLILSQRFILILEIKNWYGTILFGENGQVTRIDDESKEEGFSNPIQQTKLQQYRLRKWIEKQGIFNIPIEFFVVISYPSTIIKSPPSKNLIPKNIIHNSELLFKIQDLDSKYNLSRIRRDKLITLSRIMAESHRPRTRNILKQYQVYEEELVKGVICSKCNSLPMIRKRRKWYCKTCNYYSVNAHLAALNDFKLLLNDYITNKQLREFLLIQSPYVAKRILQKEKFKYLGRTKSRKYKLEYRSEFS